MWIWVMVSGDWWIVNGWMGEAHNCEKTFSAGLLSTFSALCCCVSFNLFAFCADWKSNTCIHKLLKNHLGCRQLRMTECLADWLMGKELYRHILDGGNSMVAEYTAAVKLYAENCQCIVYLDTIMHDIHTNKYLKCERKPTFKHTLICRTF